MLLSIQIRYVQDVYTTAAGSRTKKIYNLRVISARSRDFMATACSGSDETESEKYLFECARAMYPVQGTSKISIDARARVSFEISDANAMKREQKKKEQKEWRLFLFFLGKQIFVD